MMMKAPLHHRVQLIFALAIAMWLLIGAIAFAVELPPARYDHPYAGKVNIFAGYDGSISAIGQPCFPWMGAHACAKIIGGECYIYAWAGKLTPELLRHEIGHCNGWPADHPTH